MSFRFLSICSGIEAASVAFAPLGWTPVAFSEIEVFPSAVLRHYYPDTLNLGDLTKFMDWPEDLLVQADVICGGTPCQAFSVAGKRESLGDDRGNLSLTFIQLCNHVSNIRETRNLPAPIILWENVPGVLNTKDNAFGCFLGGLAGEEVPLVPAGDKWTHAGCVFGPQRTLVWRVLDAQYFGLAQRRKRVFVVASSGDGTGVPEILFECEGVRRDSPPSRKAGQKTPGDSETGSHWSGGPHPSLSQALKSSGSIGYSNQESFSQGGSGLVPSTLRGHSDYGEGKPSLRAKGGDCGGGSEVLVAFNWNAQACQLPGDATDTTLNHGLTCSHGAAVAFQSSQSGVDIQNMNETGDISGTILGEAMSKGGQTGLGCLSVAAFQSSQPGVRVGEVHATLDSNNGSRGHNGVMAFAQNTRDEVREMQVVGALAAEPGMKQTSYIRNHATVRRLTPIECERLQGFPDGYTAIPWRGKPSEDCPDGPRYKALGNSWAVPCVAWIGRRLDAFLKGGQPA